MLSDGEQLTDLHWQTRDSIHLYETFASADACTLYGSTLPSVLYQRDVRRKEVCYVTQYETRMGKKTVSKASVY